jgi:hypothetical protein
MQRRWTSMARLASAAPHELMAENCPGTGEKLSARQQFAFACLLMVVVDWPLTEGEDGTLLALEADLDDLVSQLFAAQEADQLPAVHDSSRSGTENASIKEAQAKRVEAIVARLYPIERAIMAAPACTTVGQGPSAGPRLAFLSVVKTYQLAGS